MMIAKRFSNSLKKLKDKVEKNKISFPALTKKLAAFNQKYTTDYLKINIHLKKPVLNWGTIDEIQDKESK